MVGRWCADLVHQLALGSTAPRHRGVLMWPAWSMMIAVATKVRKRPCATPLELGHL